MADGEKRIVGTDGVLLTEEHSAVIREAEQLGIDTYGYRCRAARYGQLLRRVRCAKGAHVAHDASGKCVNCDVVLNFEIHADYVASERKMSEAYETDQQRQHELPDPMAKRDDAFAGPNEVASSTELSTYVDRAMFEATAIDPDALDAPKVHLLSATPDPLGAVAAMMMMYEGRVVTDLAEINDEERRHYFDECFKTTLDTPLEAIDFHFLVEGVTRAHTHQEVRQRTAVFAQESMRFAVKEAIAARPGPLTRQDPEAYKRWVKAMEHIWEAYRAQIAAGIPAEEARGLLPHDTLTRVHHKVNLRSLKQELGKRTCTQAQFEWRLWAGGVAKAIREHGGPNQHGALPRYTHQYTLTEPRVEGEELLCQRVRNANWQFAYIADSPIFKPICFQTGKCMFRAQMDRGCTIRERVDAGQFDQIDDAEWACDPTAGWVR